MPPTYVLSMIHILFFLVIFLDVIFRLGNNCHRIFIVLYVLCFRCMVYIVYYMNERLNKEINYKQEDHDGPISLT